MGEIPYQNRILNYLYKYAVTALKRIYVLAHHVRSSEYSAVSRLAP